MYPQMPVWNQKYSSPAVRSNQVVGRTHYCSWGT